MNHAVHSTSEILEARRELEAGNAELEQALNHLREKLDDSADSMSGVIEKAKKPIQTAKTMIGERTHAVEDMMSEAYDQAEGRVTRSIHAFSSDLQGMIDRAIDNTVEAVRLRLESLNESPVSGWTTVFFSGFMLGAIAVGIFGRRGSFEFQGRRPLAKSSLPTETPIEDVNIVETSIRSDDIAA